MNSEWREIFDEQMEKEAKAIMEEVNSDPELKDVQAPPGMYDEIMKMIQEHEREKIYEQLSDEDRECLQIGKAYKKRRKLNRYIVLVAAIVFVLAFGTVSIGEDKNIFHLISKMLSAGERTTVNSDDAEPILYVDEEELFADIEKTYDFTAVRFGYLPKHTVFYEATFNREIQTINIIYETNKNSSLIYIIRPNYRDASFGTVIEDEKIQEYKTKVNDVEIFVTEYRIEETQKQKWSISFGYKNVTYMIRITDMDKEDVNNIVSDLIFPDNK